MVSVSYSRLFSYIELGMFTWKSIFLLKMLLEFSYNVLITYQATGNKTVMG